MQTACPSCLKKLKIPDTAAGKKVKCPACGEIFQALEDAAEKVQAEAPARRPRPAPPPVEDEEEDRPRRRREEEEEPPRSRRRREEEDEEVEERVRDRRRPARDDVEEEYEEERGRSSRRRAREEEDEDYDDRPRRKRRREEPEEEEDEVQQSGRKEARRIGKAAALWFLLAGISTIVMLTVNITTNLLISAKLPAPPPQAGNAAAFQAGRVGGMIGCGVFLIAGAISQFQAGSALKSLRGRGKVVTGIVFGFVFFTLFAIGLIVNVLGFALVPDGFLKTMILLTMVMLATTGFLNLFSAIKGIVALNNRQVGKALKKNR